MELHLQAIEKDGRKEFKEESKGKEGVPLERVVSEIGADSFRDGYGLRVA